MNQAFIETLWKEIVLLEQSSMFKLNVLNPIYVHDIECKFPILNQYISYCLINEAHPWIKKIDKNKISTNMKTNYCKLKRLYNINRDKFLYHSICCENELSCIFHFKEQMYCPIIDVDLFINLNDFITLFFIDTDYFFYWRKYGYIAIVRYKLFNECTPLLLARIIYEHIFYVTFGLESKTSEPTYVDLLSLRIIKEKKSHINRIQLIQKYKKEGYPVVIKKHKPKPLELLMKEYMEEHGLTEIPTIEF